MSDQFPTEHKPVTPNQLGELGEKIFLDRYAVKDAKKATLAVGDTVVVCVNLKTGQREIGIVEDLNPEHREVQVRLRDGSSETHSLDHIDKPLETKPEQMFDRIAKHIASVEVTPEKRAEWEEKYRRLMEDWKYVPAGRIYTGAGTDQNLTFYNCYVIPSPKDSRGGIFETLTQMTEIMSRGGGVGINVSTLRPRYAYVKGVNGRSSGSVSWASLYSFVTGLVEQGGSRRGALMLILNVWHPDVLDFINAKKEAGKITNANISVGITDDFMAAVKADKAWDLVFPDTSDPLYDQHWDGDLKKWRQLGGKVVTHKTVRAQEIWDNIITSAWSSAEPGVYFIDRANYYSNSHYYSQLLCTNPCGEQPLPAWGVCNLGHVNLAKHLTPDYTEVNWNMLKTTIQHAVRFQDNVIDATPYFFEENKTQQLSERRIGMGTIGLAEMMVRLGIRYGSDESVDFINKLYQFIAVTAYETSIELAREKGAFPRFEADKFLDSGYMKNMPDYIRDLTKAYGIRNVTILTQAPTGTVGTMVGTSTGIEPFFSWTYFRKSRLGIHQENIKLAQDWLDAHPGENLPQEFVTAMELAPEDHVKVQAAIQRWMDSAISKTCNAPADYTVEQTKKLYEMMFDMGCKGGTIYRDGSRDEQVLAVDSSKLGKDADEQVKEMEQKEVELEQSVVNQETLSVVHGNLQMKIVARERPEQMQGMTYRLRTAYGNMYVTINEDKTGPFEVFASLGKTGGFFSAQTEAITRLISLALRSNVAVEEVIQQLKGIRGPDVAFTNGETIYSVPDAIAKVLDKHIRAQQQLSLPLEIPQSPAATPMAETNTELQFVPTTMVTETDQTNQVKAVRSNPTSIADLGSAPVCLVCGNVLVMTEGCIKCEACGYSKC